MAKLGNILRYIRHYGLGSTAGLIWEKLAVDRGRFSPKIERTLPPMPKDYIRAALPSADTEQKKVNVLYLIHYFYPKKKGGTERFTLNLAKEQARLGNRPTVLVLEANEPESIYTHKCGKILYRYYEYDGISCIGFRHKRAPLGLYYKAINLNDTQMREFARMITGELETDVVHATYPQPFASFLLECREASVPYIVTCTDFCMLCHYSTMVDKSGAFCAGTCGQTRCAKECKTYGCRDFSARHEAARAVLDGAEFVTVPSEFVARILGDEFKGLPIAPVAHGISESFVYRAREGRPKKFVYAGTISSLKGIHLLIEAFCALSAEDISLDIYGEGDEAYLSRLKRMADRRVNFCGARRADEMPGIYSEADCVIVPSMWYETYNFVLREALATGALVIAAEIGAMPEAVAEGKNGYLFRPSDGGSLHEKLRLALEFDFGGYERRSFPKISDEGLTYATIYSSTTKK